VGYIVANGTIKVAVAAHQYVAPTDLPTHPTTDQGRHRLGSGQLGIKATGR
jgi:hypothetical protein